MKYKFCLHIGMHKTGSSFLQKNVFPYFRRMKFWHQPNFNIVRGSKPTSFSRFMASSPLIWRDLGKQLFDKIKKTDTDVLVSDEHTTLVNDPYRISQHVSEMRRILEPYHELRVLVVIRRQDTWFASAYAETTSEYKEVSQNHFRRWVEDRITPKKAFQVRVYESSIILLFKSSKRCSKTTYLYCHLKCSKKTQLLL